METKKPRILTPEERPDLVFPPHPWMLMVGADGFVYKAQHGVAAYKEYVESLKVSSRKSVRDEDM